MIRSFFALILTVLLFASSLGYVIHKLGDAQFLTQQARKVNMYGRISNGDNLKPLFEHGAPDKNALTAEEMNDVITQAVDGETFYSFLDQYLASTLDYITGRTNDPSFSYDLTAVKQRGVDALSAKLIANYHNLPTCQSTQLRTWSLAEELPSCQLPAGATKTSNADDQIKELAGAQINTLPDTISRPASTTSLLEIRTNVQRSFGLIRIVWIVTAVFILLFFIIARRRAFWSLASAFLLVGIVEVAFSLIAWDWIGKNVADLITSGDMKSLTPLVTDLTTAILEVFRTIFGNISIVFLALGVLMLILGFVFKEKPKQDVSVQLKK